MQLKPAGYHPYLAVASGKRAEGPAPETFLEPAVAESVTISRRAPKPASRGFMTSLKKAGRSAAAACLNGVAGLGLFLLGPRLSEQTRASYQKALRTLELDSGFRDRVASSAFDGLLELFRRQDLPGQSARERLDFVLWYTDSNRDCGDDNWTRLKQIFTHFQKDSPFLNQANDRGFAADVADGSKWYDPQATGYLMRVNSGRVEEGSPQVGHFLTAVDIGCQNPVLNRLLRPAAVGHELVGDDQGPVKQILRGLTHTKERALFHQAIAAASQGDRMEAHALVEQALPDLSVHGAEPGRVGNSKQDLLNTSYGMAFGQLVRDGKLVTSEDAATWLYQNVGRGADSLPWAEPNLTS